MNNALHATCYADNALQRRVSIVENSPIACDTFRVRFRCPEIARRLLPGQFLMVRLAEYNDPLIGRPLAVYDILPNADGRADAIDVVYLVKGKLTTRLARLQPGQPLDIWGPLGNGFPATACGRLVMVAGGIGQTPFLTLAKQHLGLQQFGDLVQRHSTAQVTLCYGARTANLLAGVEDFERVGVQLQLATEDGSRGHHGLVTEVLEQTLCHDTTDTLVVCCGPEAMMQAAAEVARRCQVPCQVSLETPMACGVGICFTCVAKVADDQGGWDYKRTCVDGPVFDAQRIVW